MANEAYAKGSAAFSAGDFAEAMRHFTDAIAVAPANHLIYSSRSATYASLCRYAEALDDASKTVELKPDWSNGYSLLGAAHLGLGNFAEAVSAYERALSVDPSNEALKSSIADARSALATKISKCSEDSESTEHRNPDKDKEEEVEVEEELDSKECFLHKYFVQEWLLVKSILDRIVSDSAVKNPNDVNRIRSIMDKYQEQGQLLEPYLESLVTPLMAIVRTRAVEVGVATDEILEIIKPLCILIYTLVTVCGYKSVIRFFPHQVSDLELAVTLLEKCQYVSSGSSLRQESTGEMEMKCILLLWLNILVLIPFDISSVDTSITSINNLDGFELSPLVLKILEMSKGYLSSAGPMRRISGLLLARLLTRPDMPKAFSRFTGWAHEVLLSAKEDFVNHFTLIGVVEALASIFKVGSRFFLLSVVSTTWNDSSLLMKSATAARSPLLRKLLVKLSQRTALTCLPHRSPLWRYKGKVSCLGENFLLNAAEKSNSCSHGQYIDSYNGITNPEGTQEDIDVPELVEEIIELLLSGLKDSDTVVRWSAAKGIGRLTARLISSFAEDVLSSVLELFSPGEGDGSWHGGCLALAELARRGLLLPVNFSKVVPVIIKDPAVCYPRLVQLLQFNCYSRSVLAGYVISVGGLQESLRRASVAALLDYVQAVDDDAIDKKNAQEYKLSTDLLSILQQYQKCDRVITPTFKTIEVLLSKKVFLNMKDFGAGILDSLHIELKGSKDFTKLCTGLSILGYIASLAELINTRALSQLLFFLGHRYPKIRKAAADQAYLVLLQNENLVAEGQTEKAFEVLAETCWEGVLDAARLGRSQLYEIAGLENHASQISHRTASKGSEGKSLTDENVSYSSLVDFSGF